MTKADDFCCDWHLNDLQKPGSVHGENTSDQTNARKSSILPTSFNSVSFKCIYIIILIHL